MYIYGQNFIKGPDLYAKFTREDDGPEREFLAKATFISPTQVVVKMPKLPDTIAGVAIEASQYFVQISVNREEYSSVDAAYMIGVWKTWNTRIRAPSRRNSDVYNAREERRRQTATQLLRSTEEIPHQEVTETAVDIAKKQIQFTKVECKWPTRENSKNKSLINHLINLEDKNELEPVLLGGFSALTHECAGLKDQEQPSGGNPASENSTNGLLDYDRFKKLVVCKLYPMATERQLKSLWQEVDVFRRGYVSPEQVRSLLFKSKEDQQFQRTKADIEKEQETRASPPNPVSTKGTAAFLSTKSRFDLPPINDLQYQSNDALVKERAPSWGIGKEHISYGVKMKGRPWTQFKGPFRMSEVGSTKDSMCRAASPPRRARIIPRKLEKTAEDYRAELKRKLAPGVYDTDKKTAAIQVKEPQRPSSNFYSQSPRFKSIKDRDGE